MNVSLHTSALPAQAHDAVVLPWLERAARMALQTRRTTAVLVPLRADAYHLKARALVAGIGLCGVHFLTPGDVRDRLAAHLGVRSRVPLREHLRLLLATAAERVGTGDGEHVAAIAAGPDQLLKAIDLIGGGGWSFAAAGPARLRPVVREFQRLLEDAGFSMVHDLDRALLAATRPPSPLFADLLVIGFNALHWPLWPLLEAAVRAAEFATVCLTDPRPEAEALDAAWVGTWEETFGAAEPIAADSPESPLADLWHPSESAPERAGRAAQPVEAVTFLVGQDTAEQARAIVAQAVQFLADPACARLSVLFPAAGALSRRVAALLADLAVPHHDGLAHHAPGPLEDAAWPAWLALQENPRLPALLAFLRARPEEHFAGLSVGRATGVLQRIFQELLLDDLAVLATYLERHSREPAAPALAAALDALPLLPERAALGEFLTRSDTLFRALGWVARAEELQRLAGDWREALPLLISRRAWLRWLRETLVSWRTERAPAGGHPYSRLHLLPYAQAEAQGWTHLIATGLNEGQWPPTLEDAGFLGEEEIDALNQRLHALNTRAATQGRQGEGHITVEAGKAFCLGPAQRRALAARQFLNTLEAVTHAIAVSAQLHEEAAPERPFNPGEFFTRLYFCARGRAVSQDTMAALQGETARWLAAGALWPEPPADPAIGAPTRRAYEARRLPADPFGEYEFALRTPPQPPLRLAAKRWESAFTSPAEVWLGAILGVSANALDAETPWALAQGNWVHDWLRALAGGAPPQTLAPRPAPAELHARVRNAALALRASVAAVLAAHRRTLPDWWASAWAQALGLATPLAESVAQVSGRTHVAAEWTLGDCALPIDDGTLRLRGRIDLLLTTAESLEDVWVVDYKTGNRQGLRTKDLEKGDGIQLALYALALRAAGAQRVGLSLLTPGAAFEDAQLTLAELDALPALWRGLLRMQETGVFGLRGALRAEHGFRSAYPLAMLAIDEEILAEKWSRTHPDFAPVEDEA